MTRLLILLLTTILFANDYGDTYINSGNTTTNNSIYNSTHIITKIDTSIILDTIYRNIYYGNKINDTLNNNNIDIHEYNNSPLTYIKLKPIVSNVNLIADQISINFKNINKRVCQIIIKTYPENKIHIFDQIHSITNYNLLYFNNKRQIDNKYTVSLPYTTNI